MRFSRPVCCAPSSHSEPLSVDVPEAVAASGGPPPLLPFLPLQNRSALDELALLFGLNLLDWHASSPAECSSLL